MIIIRIGNLTLVDFEVLVFESGGRAEATIRKHCEPMGRHRATGRLLYNADEARKILAKIPTRERTKHKQT